MKCFYIDLLKHRKVALALKPLIKIPIDDVTHSLTMCKEKFEMKYKSIKPEKSDALVFICNKGMTANKAVFLSGTLGYKNAFNFHILKLH